MKSSCETCPTIQDCKTAFGKYWGEKSHGGVGCDHPFKYDRYTTSASGASRQDEDGKRTTASQSVAPRRASRNRIAKQESFI